MCVGVGVGVGVGVCVCGCGCGCGCGCVCVCVGVYLSEVHTSPVPGSTQMQEVTLPSLPL